MKHYTLDQIEEKELYPGFIARIIHTDRQSISYVRCLQGAKLPPHKHSEEQVLNLLEGEMDVTVAIMLLGFSSACAMRLYFLW